MFFSFDGVDGVGKSTQMKRFQQWLVDRGQEVVACRDPGSTLLGEAIRRILLEHNQTPIHRRSEMLLYMAARTQLVEEIIRPALEAGKTVVCDRFLLANIVYQGHAGGVDLEQVRAVGAVAVAGIVPDLTFLLDMPADEAQGRAGRAPDRMEAQGLAYLERVREGFLQEARRQPQIVRIDAGRPIEEVQEEIRRIAESRWVGRKTPHA